MRIKLAFGSVPKDGGTFTFYKNIRPYLEQYNIEIYCVAVGKEQGKLWEDSYADEKCVLLASGTYNVKKQSKIFTKWCIKNSINMVMGINSEAILSAIPHLPNHIRVVSRCANAFDHGYKITMSGKERLEAIFAITPKLEKDLIISYKAPSQLVHLIPNGINPKPFNKASKVLRGNEKKLKLGFLGRLEHNQKGVLHIPHIANLLKEKDVEFELVIAGKGKHRELLEKELKFFIEDGSVKFLGALTADQVPYFFEHIDIYLFPSHFEGCPNALLEALMSGCVPIAWLIEGITDYIIKEGVTGYLHELGDYESIANTILALNNNRSKLNELSLNASKDARERFTPNLTAKAYAKVLKQVIEKPLIEYNIKSWSDFEIDENFFQKSDKWIPRAFKMFVKNKMIKFIK